jgi:hypothetical protein
MNALPEEIAQKARLCAQTASAEKVAAYLCAIKMAVAILTKAVVAKIALV